MINNLESLREKFENISRENLEQKKFGEVTTPISIVEQILDCLDEGVWENPNLKWLDPCVGAGQFVYPVVKRLMNGLSNIIQSPEHRYKHIMEKMIFVCEIQQRNVSLYMEYFNPDGNLNINMFNGDFLSEQFDSWMKEKIGNGCVDILMMNSPYQTPSDGKHHRSRPLYNLFIEKAIAISDKILSIHPSRWMKKSIGLEDFRTMMLSRRDIKIIRNFKNAKDVFGKHVELRGGVQYFLIDKNYNGQTDFDGTHCYLNKFDIFVDPGFYSVLEKVISDNNLSIICESNSLFMNFNNKNLLDNFQAGTLLCYVSKVKGNIKFIKEEDISKKGRRYINSWKVFTPFAAGYGTKFNFFGAKIIGKPGEVCSNSYLTIKVDDENQAKSLVSYMDTKFCNFFLSLRKSTQNMNKDTLRWIPIVPFDREWTDGQLFELFNINDNEKELILNS